MPGAGFTPEAVPGNSAETKNTRTVSHSFGNIDAGCRRLKHRNCFTAGGTGEFIQDRQGVETEERTCANSQGKRMAVLHGLSECQ